MVGKKTFVTPAVLQQPGRSARTGFGGPLGERPIDLDQRVRAGVFLLDAANSVDERRIREHLADGASPNARNAQGRTPLMEVILSNRAGEKQKAECVSVLIKANADPGATDHHGMTAADHARKRNLGRLEKMLEPQPRASAKHGEPPPRY